MSSMSYFRICTMRSIQKTTFCGFIALLKKVLDFGGQLADKFSFILTNFVLRPPANSLFGIKKIFQKNRLNWILYSQNISKKSIFLGKFEVKGGR